MKLASDELREVLMFCGQVKDFHCKTKMQDKKGKTHYKIETNFGEALVYSSKLMYINNVKVNSISEARNQIYRYI